MDKQCIARTLSKNGPRCNQKRLYTSKYCLKHRNLLRKSNVLKWGNFKEFNMTQKCDRCKEDKKLDIKIINKI